MSPYHLRTSFDQNNVWFFNAPTHSLHLNWPPPPCPAPGAGNKNTGLRWPFVQVIWIRPLKKAAVICLHEKREKDRPGKKERETKSGQERVRARPLIQRGGERPFH